MADYGRIAYNSLETFLSQDTDSGRVASIGLETFMDAATDQGRIAAIHLETFNTPPLNRGSVAWVALETFLDPPDVVIPDVTPVTSYIESADLIVELHIYERVEPRPLTGKFSTTEDIPGWKWDRKRLEDSRHNYAQYLSTLGGHTVGLKDGTIKEWWQSGTISGCGYLDTVMKQANDYLTWTPRVATGEYGVWFEKHHLFSDYSYTGLFASDRLDNGLMYVSLRDDTQWDSIRVVLYKRDDAFLATKYWDFNYADPFTGEIDESSHTRLNTEDGNGTINPANLSTRKKEFLIRDGRVVLNGNHYVDVTFTIATDFPEVPNADVGNIIEDGGVGHISGRNVFSKYFPVETNTVRVLVDEGGTDLIEYEATDNLAFSLPTERHFQLDNDLGIVQMAGYKAPDLILKTSLGEFDTSIEVYEDESIDTYPPMGVLLIDSEEIAYYSRTRSGFRDLVRGYNTTTIANHQTGVIVSHRQMGLGTNGHIYLEYRAVPRIEYEVTPYAKRTANKNSWLDIKPIHNIESNNVVQIYPGEISLDSIVLTTDSPLIGSNLYGPVYYGSDVSRLTATALDPHSNPVSDTDLAITILDGGGLLNGSSTTFTDLTNTLGQIYSLYNHSMDQASLEYHVSDISYDGSDSLMTVTGLPDGISLSDIWVFQVVKYDKILGTVGLPLAVINEGTAIQPYGLWYIDIEGLVSQDFRDGIASIIIGGIKYYRAITWIESTHNVDDSVHSRLYLDSVLPTAIGETVYLLENQALAWDPALLNGMRLILYEFNSEVQHPLTGDTGAYYPLQPDTMVDNVLTFSGRQLPQPDASDPTNNLGAYIVVAPGRVSLQAYGTDPLTGRLIQSNIIRLDTELPNFFIGVDKTGTLPVPVGWRFPTDEFNIGGGIGGANFITINPRASGVQQFALAIDIT